MAHQPASRGRVHLERHHTHFVLVDDGQEGSAANGCEARLRLALERQARRHFNVPRVLVVLQGGVRVLGHAAAALQEGALVVVIAESGGAAGELTLALTSTTQLSLTLTPHCHFLISIKQTNVAHNRVPEVRLLVCTSLSTQFKRANPPHMIQYAASQPADCYKTLMLHNIH